MYLEHQLPEGTKVCEFKICELCGVPFIRDLKDFKDKHCIGCINRLVTLNTIRILPERSVNQKNKQLILDAFAKTPRMTQEQLKDAIPGCVTAKEAGLLCRLANIKLTRIGTAPRISRYGKAPGIYAMLETPIVVKDSKVQLISKKANGIY